jgi:hypothetical protein
MDLLREPTPGVREALNVAESFGLSMPKYDTRHTADADMADHIGAQGPASTSHRRSSQSGRAAINQLQTLVTCQVAAIACSCSALL